MSIYSKINYNLVSRNVKRKDEWECKKFELHRHHIVPKHMGGLDEESNYTYLTVREHIISHYLLWKMYGNMNDLRSMHMLGANLNRNQRKAVGKWCYQNGIGFHGASKKEKIEWAKKGFESQKIDKNSNSFYWWSTKEGRIKRASLGGKASAPKQIEKRIGIHTENNDLRKEWASKGGQSHKGKRAMHKPGDKSFVRVHPNDIEHYFNEGYVLGSPIKNPNKSVMKGKPSPNRKSINFRGVHYDSMKAACEATGLSYYHLNKELSAQKLLSLDEHTQLKSHSESCAKHHSW